MSPGAAEKLALLRRHPFFAELDTPTRSRIAALARTHHYARGATIFRKGELGSCLFAVCRGLLQAGAPSVAGKDAVFSIIGEGEIFGEIAFLDGGPRTADALALTDCELLILERRDFLPVLRDDPDLALRILEVLCARLRRTSEQVEDLLFLDLKARLAKALLRLSSRGEAQREAQDKIATTQQELATLLGLSREMINKQLRAWAKQGWLRLGRGEIIILEARQLARIADPEG